MNSILIVLSLVTCFVPIVIESKGCKSPYEICRKSSNVGVIANGKNVIQLMKILKEANVESAFVYGWEDHRKVMILTQNGTLTPYIKGRNSSKHALCIGVCPSRPRRKTKNVVDQQKPISSRINQLPAPLCYQSNGQQYCSQGALSCQTSTATSQLIQPTAPPSCQTSTTTSQLIQPAAPPCCQPSTSVQTNIPQCCSSGTLPCQTSDATSQLIQPAAFPSCQSIATMSQPPPLYCQTDMNIPQCCSLGPLPCQTSETSIPLCCQSNIAKINNSQVLFNDCSTYKYMPKEDCTSKCRPIKYYRKEAEICCDCNGEEIGFSTSKEQKSKIYTYTFIDDTTFELFETEKVKCIIETLYYLDLDDVCRPARIPEVLYHPDELYRIQRELSETYNQNVCLYITDCNNIIVIINQKVYNVEINKCDSEIEIKWMTNEQYERLVERGLYQVSFEN